MKQLTTPELRCSLAVALLSVTVLEAAAGVAGASGQQSPPPRNGSLPAVSPDGMHIAFLRTASPGAEDIYVIGADGNGEHLIARSGDGPVQWTRDGRLYWSTSDWQDDTAHVLVVALDGGTPTPFQSFLGRDAVQMPDGDFIVATGKYPKQRPGHLRNGAMSAQVFPVPAGSYFNIATSPDGRQVAFAHADSGAKLQVWVMGTDGTGLRRLTNFAPEDGSPQWPSWSPDGKTVAFQSGKYSKADPASNTSHIWVLDVATSKATRLAPHTKPYLDETPSFFPDGKRLAFQSDRTGRMEVWVMNVDGSGARQVTR